MTASTGAHGVVLLILGSASFGAIQEAAAQTTVLDPRDPGWTFSGEARAARHEGEDVLYLRRGSALRPDVRFTDGTIEFEVYPTDERTFLGVLFRIPEEGHREDIYFRLHKSKLPDAIQYSPDYRGRGQWQLYHGPSATAAAPYRPSTWQRIRIEVRGDRAAVFVGAEAGEPQLVVDRLRTGVGEGSIGFWGNFPGAQEDDPPTALLRDITIRHGTTAYEFPRVDPEPARPGTIREWGISTPFVRRDSVIREIPSDAAADGWHTVEAEPSGVVPLDRHVDRSEGGAVLAGLTLRSDVERVVPLDLGFSDDVSVFLNGRLLYSGVHSFSHNFPRRQGLITLDQATLYLSLRAGENRLVAAVSEIFGGWGVMGRIEERDGLVVEPLR